MGRAGSPLSKWSEFIFHKAGLSESIAKGKNGGEEGKKGKLAQAGFPPGAFQINMFLV